MFADEVFGKNQDQVLQYNNIGPPLAWNGRLHLDASASPRHMQKGPLLMIGNAHCKYLKRLGQEIIKRVWQKKGDGKRAAGALQAHRLRYA